ncbi:hypothetical protein HMPREF1062_04301 [Bacteroides cellulosilyticus CL02T12C19]|uniref:Uncharacterized protein n=2 Tax=Bacteroides TaxID=816 RepID=I9EZG8_9BACE|nr:MULTISPECIES: hypothetical protein [Bacteroides]EIY25959.1 hypothetical protein HMPREF1062_04301 [Bacteroides cellulosilyticus CL02T12C19]MCM0371199.1 hypothetical protein [Bacteroides fragilis]MCZ2653184.1 hypothetical protein [Bacteroides fragilis]
MFLSEDAQCLIKSIRDEKNGGVESHKASVSDAMGIIMNMHEMHASPKEQEMLINALFVLANYNQLLTELSKEK